MIMISFDEVTDDDIHTRVKHKGRWVVLTHYATISPLSPLILEEGKLDRKYRRMSANLSPELCEWLKGKPYNLYYQGRLTMISLTKKDMALFKLFFG